jgi:hypothetical protein
MKDWLAKARVRAKYNAIVAAMVLAVMGYQAVALHLELRGKPELDPFAEFRTAIERSPQRIAISSWPGCAEHFEIHLTDEQSTRFIAASAFADQQRISGHSGPILEAKLVIVTPQGPLEYYATVNRYEPNDLFLRRRLRTTQPDGSTRDWQYSEIRIPDLGKWMFIMAPGAAL